MPGGGPFATDPSAHGSQAFQCLVEVRSAVIRPQGMNSLDRAEDAHGRQAFQCLVEVRSALIRPQGMNSLATMGVPCGTEDGSKARRFEAKLR